ncbi:unnamed protein product [Didymodactylos carnosus]|uniref:BTB domain-containing protein n=1 Tax=Didymodactylos carnosus TaxID=1234261 RepID=A0A813QWU2_9BILA|nr:unnamed protein product [Didymodactylos carnosus]CAF0774266.1 unnamed protein product [Didymodactylos carnosus]CAF3555350.1 unnamed protein product [Didymodactylos carnosus]CAF3555352.1 unnamed protein product [Didymodactylos carnosus]
MSNSWKTTPTSTTSSPSNSIHSQIKTDTSSSLYKIEHQTIIHRWFLPDIRALYDKPRGQYLQSSTFGCTGEDGPIEWAIRFYPIYTLKKHHQHRSEHPKTLSNTDKNNNVSSSRNRQQQENLIYVKNNADSRPYFNRNHSNRHRLTLSEKPTIDNKRSMLDNSIRKCLTHLPFKRQLSSETCLFRPIIAGNRKQSSNFIQYTFSPLYRYISDILQQHDVSVFHNNNALSEGAPSKTLSSSILNNTIGIDGEPTSSTLCHSNGVLLNVLQRIMNSNQNKFPVNTAASQDKFHLDQLFQLILSSSENTNLVQIANNNDNYQQHEQKSGSKTINEITHHQPSRQRTNILNPHTLKQLPGGSVSSASDNSSIDELCTFEIMCVNDSSQTLFETIYQVFSVSDDGYLSLLLMEGRQQVHFERALIHIPRDTVFSVDSNNILFSVKLIVYEWSTTVDHWQLNQQEPLASCPYHSKLLQDSIVDDELKNIANIEHLSTNVHSHPIQFHAKNNSPFNNSKHQQLTGLVQLYRSMGRTIHHDDFVEAETRTKRSSSNDDCCINNDAKRRCPEPGSGEAFWFMCQRNLFTDISIRASCGRLFHAHRIILYSSCEKLAEIIGNDNHDMLVIEIQNLNGVLLEKVLKFIYTGKVEIFIGGFNLDEANQLIIAADAFNLVTMKSIISKRCMNHITQRNCLELLQLADNKNMKSLKGRVLGFLCNQFPQVHTFF